MCQIIVCLVTTLVFILRVPQVCNKVPEDDEGAPTVEQL